MKLEHRFDVPAPRARVWTALLDLPAMASCVPGASELARGADDRYTGRFGVSVGPVRLALEGALRLEVIDEAAGHARLTGNGTDRRLGGGVRAIIELHVGSRDDASTSVLVASDVQILGRIGELGQPLMKRKADEIMRAFAGCLAARLA